MIDFEVAFTKPLPWWASGKSDGSFDVVGTQLATRDGRAIGNAVVLDVKAFDEGEVQITIITDAGTTSTFMKEEMEFIFHKPEFIMNLSQSLPCCKRCRFEASGDSCETQS
jgi:hypothetical protein